MLPEMLGFFKRWIAKDPGAVLMFVTNESPDTILPLAGSLGIPAKSIFIRSAQRKQVPLYIAACDYSIFFIKPVFSKRASSPTKQGEIMAMGKPAICNSGVGDSDHVVNEYKSGILVNDFTDTEYDRVIEEVVNIDFDRQAIRLGAQRFFSLEQGIQKYREVYQNLSND
jgi:hypothetical protein